MKDKVKFWRPQAEKWAKQTDVPAALILAVIQMESGGQPHVTRYEPTYKKRYVDDNRNALAKAAECGLTREQYATSYGLMQLMFQVAYGYGARSIADVLDPHSNIRYGAAHLGALRKRYCVGVIDGAGIRSIAGAYNGAGDSSAYARGVYNLYLKYEEWLKNG